MSKNYQLPKGMMVALETQEINMKKKLKLMKEVFPDKVVHIPNAYLYHKNDKCLTITTGEAWYKRIWFLVSNPFRYLFVGRVKF